MCILYREIIIFSASLKMHILKISKVVNANSSRNSYLSSKIVVKILNLTAINK